MPLVLPLPVRFAQLPSCAFVPLKFALSRHTSPKAMRFVTAVCFAKALNPDTWARQETLWGVSKLRLVFWGEMVGGISPFGNPYGSQEQKQANHSSPLPAWVCIPPVRMPSHVEGHLKTGRHMSDVPEELCLDGASGQIWVSDSELLRC